MSVHINVSRKFVPHALLLSAASRALDAAKNKSDGQWWDWLSTTLYCSLSIEAIANTYGETFITRWSDFETASPLAKLRLVAEHCRLEADFGRHPWSIARQLIRFRNRIAHAKLEELSVTGNYPEDQYTKFLYSKPQSKLEEMVSERFARESYDGVYEILRLFAGSLPQDMIMELETESWHGGAQLG